MSLRVDCADVGLIRTPSRMEMLYPRSQIVTAAKAYGLQAIDLVSNHWISSLPLPLVTSG